MFEIIFQSIQEFMAYYGLDVAYELEQNGRIGKAIINGKEYLLIFRDQPRVKELKDLIPRLNHGNIFLISHKLYSTAQAYLEEEGVSYLEWQGHMFFTDWEGDESMKKRFKKNYFDQRINESRLKCKNGSAMREAVLIEPELVNKPVKEIAEGLNIGKSTVYYFLKQMKLIGYIKKVDDVVEIDEEIFDEDEIMENLLVRGCHTLIPHWKFERYELDQPIQLQGWGEALRGCKFYDKLDHCENMCELVKRESSKGYLIFISPYSRGSLKQLDQSFRKRFETWFMKRQDRIRGESG